MLLGLSDIRPRGVMPEFTDQMHRNVVLGQFPPRRIVSLVPSQTELLQALGLEEEVVGITKFCVHPAAWFRTKQRVGGTKTVHLDKVAALSPDLIIGNKEENDREQVEELAARFPVWMSDVADLRDALRMIGGVGDITGRSSEAVRLVQQLEQRFSQLRQSAPAYRLRVAYFIWRKPYMVAGGDTFIDAMLNEAGFSNVFSAVKRYPEIALDQLARANPEAILLSSEPYPFAEKHFGPLQEACPAAKIKIVDGELFSWYGSRLLKAPSYFQEMRESLVLASP